MGATMTSSRKVGASAKQAGNRGLGRKRGVPNKFTGTLKEMILKALDDADPDGGTGYLTKQAKENPTAFMTLVGKVLPMTVASDPDNPLPSGFTVQLVAGNAEAG